MVKDLTNAQTCAYVAGLTASADAVTSNTFVAYEGATGIVGEKITNKLSKQLRMVNFSFLKIVQAMLLSSMTLIHL